MDTTKTTAQTQWPPPAHLDPEPNRVTNPGAWYAWRFREQMRIPASELL